VLEQAPARLAPQINSLTAEAAQANDATPNTQAVTRPRQIAGAVRRPRNSSKIQRPFRAANASTTAAPKGVVATHRNLFDHLGTLVRRFGYDSHSRILNNMVLSHNDGLVQGPLLALACGGTLLRTRPLDARNVGPLLDDVYALKATHFITVPTILAIAASRAEHEDYFSGVEFKHLVSVAAKLDPSAWRKAQDRFGTRISNIYGLTETIAGGLYCGPDDASHEIGTVGVPDDMDAMIMDEAGAEVAPGIVGELWLRGSNVVPGYWEDPGATAALRAGEWLRTGDLAIMNPQGYINIVGRVKDMIIRGGENLFPAEIESFLIRYSKVAEAQVVGVPDPLMGEEAVALLRLKPETSADEDEIREYCRNGISRHKIPKYIKFVTEFPLTASGKVKKFELRAQLIRELGLEKLHEMRTA